MLNNAEPFQVGPNSTVHRDNPRDSRYKFSLRLLFLKPWSKKDPGKDGVQKPSCFSDFPTRFGYNRLAILPSIF
jgi:hypothetical protein